MVDMETTTNHCGRTVWRRYSRGVLGKGIESFKTRPEPCGRPTEPGHEFCSRCEKASAKMLAGLARKAHR